MSKMTHCIKNISSSMTVLILDGAIRQLRMDSLVQLSFFQATPEKSFLLEQISDDGGYEEIGLVSVMTCFEIWNNSLASGEDFDILKGELLDGECSESR